MLFDVFPGREEPLAPEEERVALPDRGEGLPEGAVFDAANADEFAAMYPSAAAAASVGTLEREAESLAVFFLERFGTYSSDSGNARFTDLAGFMTAPLVQELESYAVQNPVREGFYSITAELGSIETEEFAPERRAARFRAVLNRTEVSGGAIETYQQEAVIDLSQSGSSEWLVSGVAWGERI